jgi:hypothetical protein
MLKKRTRVPPLNFTQNCKIETICVLLLFKKKKGSNPSRLLPSREVTLDNNRGLKKGVEEGSERRRAKGGQLIRQYSFML